jgi:L-alanine-DL-glutamate epimerase-like enolase superfamily enzyme
MGVGLRLAVSVESFPIKGGFTSSRGSKHEAVVVVATIDDGTHAGRGECVPYARYGESVEGVVVTIKSCASAVAGGVIRAELASLLPAGAARNALDCALWDLEAKRSGVRVAEHLGLALLHVPTAHFVARDRGDGRQGARGGRASAPQTLLGGDGDRERLAAGVAWCRSAAHR